VQTPRRVAVSISRQDQRHSQLPEAHHCFPLLTEYVALAGFFAGSPWTARQVVLHSPFTSRHQGEHFLCDARGCVCDAITIHTKVLSDGADTIRARTKGTVVRCIRVRLRIPRTTRLIDKIGLGRRLGLVHRIANVNVPDTWSWCVAAAFSCAALLRYLVLRHCCSVVRSGTLTKLLGLVP
jgi:hypothetical protein